MKKEECAKLLLNFTCAHFKNFYSLLHRKLQSESLGYIALYMAENSIEFMENLLKNISKNEILAEHFLHQIKGLDMVFEILDRCAHIGSPGKAELPFPPESLITQLHENFLASTQQIVVSESAKNIHSANRDKAIFDEEFGNRIKNLPDELGTSLDLS